MVEIVISAVLKLVLKGFRVSSLGFYVLDFQLMIKLNIASDQFQGPQKYRVFPL